MRLSLSSLVLSCVCTLGACADESVQGLDSGVMPDGGANDAGIVVSDSGADAGVVADCVLPTTGRYAIGNGVGSTKLFLLGDGLDAWDAEIGELTLDGNSLQFETLAFDGTTHYLTLAGFVYTFDPTVVTPSREIPVTLAYSFSLPSFTAYSHSASEMGADYRTIYCISGGELFSEGLAVTEACTQILAMYGTCEAVDLGTLSMTVYAYCGSYSRRITLERTSGMNSDIPNTSMSSDIPAKIVGVSPQDGYDLVATEDGDIGRVTGGVYSLERHTRLCVDPGNPFNGQRLSLSGME